MSSKLLLLSLVEQQSNQIYSEQELYNLHPQAYQFFAASSSWNADTGKALEIPVGVPNVILVESASLMEISQIVIQIRISLLLTPVRRFIRRSETNAVTSVSYQTLRPIPLK